MKKTEPISAIVIPSHSWRDFNFDDEFFMNRAVLDLQAQSLIENFPTNSPLALEQIRKQEDQTLQLISTSLFPNLFLISIQ